MAITTCISSVRSYNCIIRKNGVIQNETKVPDKWEVNCIQNQFNPSIPDAKRGQRVKEIKKRVKQGDKKGVKK